MYADYNFYKDYGKAPEEDYKYLSSKASYEMDYYTFDRLKSVEITEKIKVCQCELVNLFYQIGLLSNSAGDTSTGTIKSETVDTWKVEYNISKLSDTYGNKSIEQMVQDICRKYVIRYMYVGVDLYDY